MYLNIAWCNIKLPQLVSIAEKFENCPKLEYLSIAGNQFSSHRDQGLKNKLVQLICDLIERPQSQLSHLDISDLQMDALQLRRVLKAVQRNTRLLSLNLGSYEDKAQTDMVRDALELREYKQKVCFTSCHRMEMAGKEQ